MAEQPDRRLLSRKDIPARERLIFALDVATADEARRVAEQLLDDIHFFKIGLQLFAADGYFKTLDWLVKHGKKCFVDLKFFDVPETVASAVANIDGRNAAFATVHGNEAILQAACKARRDTRILAVTVLTSMDDRDLQDLGFPDAVKVEDLVLSRARRALRVGCDGVISSGLEAARLRGELGDNFLVVVPGIRPLANVDDQKRTVDVEDAFLQGADYIVVGRPIRMASDPALAARDMQDRIARLFAP